MKIDGLPAISLTFVIGGIAAYFVVAHWYKTKQAH